jgi:hypothetical protein
MKAKGKITIWISITLMLTALAMTGTACLSYGSGGFGIQGIVYEWVDAPAGADSLIYIQSNNIAKEAAKLLEEMDDEISANYSLVALEDAEIAVSHKKLLDEGSDLLDLYSFKLCSDADGRVTGGMVVPPQRDIYVLRVTKPGYRELVTEIDHYEFNHAIVVLLIKEDSTD